MTMELSALGINPSAHVVELLINRIEAPIDGVKTFIELPLHRSEPSVDGVESSIHLFDDRRDVSFGKRYE